MSDPRTAQSRLRTITTYKSPHSALLYALCQSCATCFCTNRVFTQKPHPGLCAGCGFVLIRSIHVPAPAEKSWRPAQPVRPRPAARRWCCAACGCIFLYCRRSRSLATASAEGISTVRGVGLPCLEGCKILICRGVQQVFINRQRSGSQSRIDGMSAQRSASTV